VKVKVLYFAGLREQLGTPGEEPRRPATTVAGLRSQLMAAAVPGKSALAQGKRCASP